MAKQGSITGFTLKFLLRLFLGISFLLLLCVIWPIFIYRKLVSILASIFRSDLGLILSPQSTLLNPASNPKLNVCIQLRLSGKLDLSRLTSRFTQECIFRKHVSTGKFLFPEFQQYYTTWLGYPFWKNEASFQIDQHVHHLVFNKTEDLQPELRNVLETQFSDSQSPWEINFVETIDNPNCHYVWFKFHHALADGYSILNALGGVADAPVQQLQPKREERVSFRTQVSRCINHFHMFFLVLEGMFKPVKSEWDSLPFTGERYTGFTDTIPLSSVKELSFKHDASVSTITMAIITGATRRMMLKNGISNPPSSLLGITFIRLPHESSNLTNSL